MTGRPNVVLVHGAWADGSCWTDVIERLQAAGYCVRAPQVPLTSLPSWYLVAKNDEALPPDAERQFATRMGATTVEVSASHVAMVSHPDDVAGLIERAAESVGAAALS